MAFYPQISGLVVRAARRPVQQLFPARPIQAAGPATGLLADGNEAIPRRLDDRNAKTGVAV
jgi:hypothetical protein